MCGGTTLPSLSGARFGWWRWWTFWIVLLVTTTSGEASHPGPVHCFDCEDAPLSFGELSDDDLLVGEDFIAWNGDIGIPDELLEDWRMAENALRLNSCHSNSSSSSKKGVPKGQGPSEANLPGDPFIPAAGFAGAMQGYVYKRAQSGLGYYIDNCNSKAVAKALVLDELVKDTSHLCNVLADAPSGSLPTCIPMASKRARRARLPNGARKKFPTRRLRAMKVADTFFQELPVSAAIDDTSWKEGGLFAVDTANGNSWRSLEDAVLLRSSADVILSQESKLHHEDRLAGATLAARAAGWSPALSLAHRTQASFGSGGNGVFLRKGNGVTDYTKDLVPEAFWHRICVAWGDTIVKGGVYFISIWPVDSQGLSPTNMAILETVGGILATLKSPWIIGGDWNMSPEVLQESNWPSMVHGSIVATLLATCNWSVYDYFVVSSCLRHAVAAVQRISDGGLNPHWVSRLLIRGDARRHAVRCLVKPAKVSGLLPFGPPNKPPSYEAIAATEPTPQGIQAATIQWYKLARQEFSDLAGIDLGFKEPKFKWANAAGPPANEAGSSRVSVMWRSLARSAEDIRRASTKGHHLLTEQQKKTVVSQMLACRNTTKSLPRKQACEVLTMVEAWCNSLQAALSAASCNWMQSLQNVADQKAKVIEQRTVLERKRAWRAKIGAEPSVAGAAAAPTRAAYRWTRGTIGWTPSAIGKQEDNDEVPEIDDVEGAQDAFDDTLVANVSSPVLHSRVLRGSCIPLSDQAAVQKESDSWASLSQVDQPYTAEFGNQVDSQFIQRLAPWALTLAARSFPVATGLGADNAAPRAFARLSDEAMLALCTLFSLCEVSGTWAEVIQLVLIVLLPKADGGLRPIGLFPTVVRIWMRARVTIARVWEAQNALPSIYGGAGMGAQRAAWEAAFIAELAALRDLVHVDSLLDLVKAFETVPHQELIDAAERLGYPTMLLRLSLAAYRFQRAVGIDGVFGKLAQATRGIIAGSGFATTELRIILTELMQELHAKFAPTVSAKLYVDDLSLAGSGPKRECIATSAMALKHAVGYFEDKLGMEVSIKKSACLASHLSVSRLTLKKAATKVATAVKFSKMLGVGFVGGRRRSTKVFQQRLKQVKSRTPRYHSLRRAGANVAGMARAAATPAITYGVDVFGLADSPLQAARSTVAHMGAPPGAGKSVDLVLHLLDGPSGTMDPMFDASLLGLRHWAYAWWESWLRAEWLVEGFQLAAAKLNDLSEWRKAHGPTTSLLCSLHRIGWSMPSASEVIDHEGCSWRFQLDSPAAILQAGHRAVRKWRLARICSALPGLAADACDFGVASQAQGSFLVDFADILKRLCKGAKPSKGNKIWQPKFKVDLTSAITGGQWSQTRRASVKKWEISDSRCQLCLEAPGTLWHRRKCITIRPEGGWPTAPPTTTRVANKLSLRRTELLTTRGLMTLRLPYPPPRAESFQWLWQSDDPVPQDARWYIDGSMLNREVWEFRAVGYGIVVVLQSRGLVAFGGGHPPHWVRTAAGAEAWALNIVLKLCEVIPLITTDCKALLDTAERGQVRAAGAKMILARVWCNIAASIDSDFSSLREQLTWMPAHITLAMVGHRVLSNGKEVSIIDWRANRLTDAIAKAFARDNVAPTGTLQAVSQARALVLHHASLLGAVTHAANNHPVQAVRKDGTSYTKHVRDVTGPSAAKKRSSGVCQQASQQPAAPAKVAAQTLAPSGAPARSSGTPPPEKLNHQPLAEAQLLCRRAAALRRKRQHELECEQLACRVGEIGSTLRPSTIHEPGCGPLDIVKARVRARLGNSGSCGSSSVPQDGSHAVGCATGNGST